MDQIISFIQTHAEYAPAISFGLLILAGFGAPISEDALIVVCALLATKFGSYFELVLTLFVGVFISDTITFRIGRLLGPKLKGSKWFQSPQKQAQFARMDQFYQKYGNFAFFIGRLIPFGFRTVMFLTAGASNISFKRFLILDFLAAALSVNIYFFLVYSQGPTILDQLGKFNKLFYGLILLLFLARKFLLKFQSREKFS